MDIVIAALVIVPFLLASLTPWWFAGRYFDVSTERVAVRDLGARGVIDTLRRGANMYVPAQFQSHRA